MPVDPIGITLSLAGLYATILDALDRISSAKAYGSDYALFITKVETERLRLFRWGQAVGLTDGGGGEALMDPVVRRGVQELMAWAVMFFEDAAAVHSRERRGSIAYVPGRNNSLSTQRVAATTVFENPRDRAGRWQKEASTLRKMRWALSGKAKAEKLVNELGWFVDRLHALVPVHMTANAQSGGVEEVLLQLVMNDRGVEEIAQRFTNDGLGGVILRLTGSSGAIMNRVENRRLQSMIRRRRMKHALRTAAGAVVDVERKIRVNERKRLESQAKYFWWCAKLGAASGSLVFFFLPEKSHSP
ncbi:prion-inhibition and propagation-domain-containing protein [Trichophaea hybrida]|nr:prion-inhibition and propagation-domain-containing protein [Trichophaea hybrida]